MIEIRSILLKTKGFEGGFGKRVSSVIHAIAHDVPEARMGVTEGSGWKHYFRHGKRCRIHIFPPWEQPLEASLPT